MCVSDNTAPGKSGGATDREIGGADTRGNADEVVVSVSVAIPETVTELAAVEGVGSTKLVWVVTSVSTIEAAGAPRSSRTIPRTRLMNCSIDKSEMLCPDVETVAVT